MAVPTKPQGNSAEASSISARASDVHVWRFVALRGEARDFYTGSPNYNIASISGGQHNIVATGAFVIRWH